MTIPSGSKCKKEKIAWWKENWSTFAGSSGAIYKSGAIYIKCISWGKEEEGEEGQYRAGDVKCNEEEEEEEEEE